MQPILVTGANGFVGRWLSINLLLSGLPVVGTCYGPGVAGCPCLVEDFAAWDFQAYPVSAVVHLAAITDPQATDAEAMSRVNTTQALDLFTRARAAGVRRIVYASSAAVYGDRPAPFREADEPKPLTPYARSKLALDLEAAKLEGVELVGLRFSNVYGPGEGHKGKSASVVYQMAKAAEAGRPVRLFKSGEQRRDWVHVMDVVRAIRAALNGTATGVFNVGSGRSWSFLEVLDTLAEVLDRPVPVEWVENPFPNYQSFTEQDVTRIGEAFGWRPVKTLKHGLADILRRDVD